MDPRHTHSSGLVLALGKASAPMARAVGDWASGWPLRGVVVGPSLAPVPGFESRAGGHPVPDQASLEAGDRFMELAREAGPTDWVFVLISGGGSAMAEVPVDGLSLEDLVLTQRLLLRSGAPVDDLNVVRKHLSKLKGGGLARALQRAGGAMSLVLSDVVGSPLSVIASGPTVPDPTSSGDAFRVLERWGLLEQVPPRVVQKLGEAVAEPEVSFPPHGVRVVGEGSTAAAAARRTAEAAQIPARILRTDVQGEAREVAGWLVEQGKQLPCPGVAICAGETTVTVRGDGLGGRNQELALAAALAIQGCPELTILSAGTDGIDGPTPAAGAFADGQTVLRGMGQGLNARDCLRRNDAYTYLRATQDLVVTGPTQTNVGDLMLVLRHPPSRG